jgi:DNA helicase HerA-like ATPase
MRTKRPIVALMKQARAFGVGVVVATQNPMDLDYRALSNAGLWCIGRLQTDADRERVIEGLAGAGGEGGLSKADLQNLVKRLAPRWFPMRDAHAKHD